MRRLQNIFPGRWRFGGAVFLLFVGTIALFYPARHFGFINCDDNTYVYENAMVRRGLSWPGLVWAFSTIEEGNWNPLVWISHMADAQWFGGGRNSSRRSNLNPGMASAYDSLGSVRALQHRSQEAGRNWAIAVHLPPNDAKAVNNLAWFYASSSAAENRRGPEAVQLALHAAALTGRQTPVIVGHARGRLRGNRRLQSSR